MLPPKRQNLFPPFATTFDGDPAECSKHLGRARGMLSLMCRSIPPVKSRTETTADGVEIRVTTNPHHIYIKAGGGIFCTAQEGDGCWIYKSSFNPVFKTPWIADDRWWFNKSTGFCVCADSGAVSSLVTDKIDIQGKGYLVEVEDLLHCCIPKKGCVISITASNEHGVEYDGNGIKYLGIRADKYKNELIEFIDGKTIGEYYVLISRRNSKLYIGGFSQDTKTLWLLDAKRNLTQWTFKSKPVVLNILDEYELDAQTTVLNTTNSVMSNVTTSGTTDTRDTTLDSSGDFIETAYVYEDVVTILTSSVTALNDHATRTTIPFAQPASGTSERVTALSVKKYENGVLSNVKTLSGLNENWTYEFDGVATAHFSHTQKRTFVLYMNSAIDLYVIMTAEISGEIASLTEFPANQHINIKIIQGIVETVVFNGTTPFGIPAYDVAWDDNFELYCPALINIDKSILSSDTGDTSLAIYNTSYSNEIQSYDPMSNYNTSAFDGKTIIICFYACYFANYVFSEMPTLANPRTLIINTKSNPLTFKLLNHRIDNPTVNKSGTKKSHNADTVSVTMT